MTLVEFLNAQLDEAEVDARSAERNAARFEEIGIQTTYSWAAHRSNSGLAFELGAPSPTLVLADIAAKRRIIETAAEVDRIIDAEWGGCRSADELWAEGRGYEGLLIVKLLAAQFADRPGYDEAWRPARHERADGVR